MTTPEKENGFNSSLPVEGEPLPDDNADISPSKRVSNPSANEQEGTIGICMGKNNCACPKASDVDIGIADGLIDGSMVQIVVVEPVI
jgi:hypothetical protein